MDVEDFCWQATQFDALADLIDEAQTIAICAHTSPDGDALGSNLGLAHLIRHKWPDKHVTSLLADQKDVPRIYKFLPGCDELVCACDYTRNPDLFICVDLPTPSRMNDGHEVLQRAKKVAVIDHHPKCCDSFADVEIVRTDAAATGVIIAEIALYWGETIMQDVATCLYCALVTDTGRFQYQNATPEAFEIASILVNAGASPSEISLNVYQSFSLEYLHLESAVMGRITTFEEGKIAYSYATNADFVRTGASHDECDGLIDVVRSVQGSEIALFLKETGDGTIRGNLRSKGLHDVSGVARALGGGGHKAAAGFSAEGTIDDVLSKCLPLLLEVVRDNVGDMREETR